MILAFVAMVILLLGTPSAWAAYEVKLTVDSGSLGGYPLNLGANTLTVAPGTPLRGSFKLQVYNGHPAASITPVAATTTWGEPSASYWQISGWAPTGASTHTVNVDVAAPSKSGIYYIVLAMAGTYNAAQLMSGTHPAWAADWVNGNKIALLPAATIETAIEQGWVPFNWYSPSGPLPGELGLTAIRIEVSSALVGFSRINEGPNNLFRPKFSKLEIGRSYQLQISTNLGTWTDHGNPFVASSTSAEYPHTWIMGNSSQMFFRLSSASSASELSSLVAYYPMDGDAVDASGNRLDGAVLGASFAPGIKGLAAAFDGTNGFITLPTTVVGGLPNGTFTAWVQIKSYPRNNAILASQGGTDCTHFFMAVSPDGALGIHVCGGIGGVGNLNSDPILTTNEWNMVSFTWDNNSWRLYVNGDLQTDQPIINYPPSNGDIFKLGRHEHISGPFYFDGLMDEVRIYSTALTAAELRRLFEAANVASSMASK